MYCFKCGSQIADDSLFCEHCGANVNKEEIKPESGGAKKPSIARAIASLSLGVMAIALAYFYFLVTIIIMGLNQNVSALLSVVAQFVFLILPACISSIIVGNDYLNSDATRLRPMAKVGKILGIITTAVSGVILFVSFIVFLVKI